MERVSELKKNQVLPKEKIPKVVQKKVFFYGNVLKFPGFIFKASSR